MPLSEDDDKLCRVDSEFSTKKIVLNLVVLIPLFYIVYYCVGSLVSAGFGIQTFDGKLPFNFKQCCLENSTAIATAISMLASFLLSAVVFAFMISARLWDYAATITILHIIATCAVMCAVPGNWEWWVCIAISFNVMLLAGEGLLFVRKYKKGQSSTKVRRLSLIPENPGTSS